MKELKVNLNLYLEIGDGETERKAIERLFNIIYRTSEDNEDFSTGIINNSEIHEC